MLNLESRMEILGITVFQDADNAKQFYYLPGNPHISYENGEPLFDLFAYRKGGAAENLLSGGFLNMTVDLGIGGLKDRIEQQLTDRFGDGVTLATVPFKKGSVRVIALGEDSGAAAGAAGDTTAGGAPLVARGPRFIENILGAGQPSMDGDNRAIFSFSLSQDGTAFFLGVMEGGVNARPVGVIYDLEYVGLFPAYDLEITINFKSAYEYMRTRFTLGTLFFRADVDNITEELKRREAIKIKETARTLELSTPEAVRERQSRIDQLVKDLASGALFQPSLTPGQPRVTADTISAENPTTSVPAGSSTVAAAMSQGPSVAVVAGMGDALRPETRRGAAGSTGSPAGGAGSPAGGDAGGAGSTGSPTGGAGSPAGGAGSPAGGGAASGGSGGNGQPQSAADVWNRLGRPQAAFALRRISQEEERTVTYNLSQVTAQQRDYAPQNFVQFLAAARDMEKHVHIIDLNHPFFERLTINVNSRDVDFAAEGVSQLTVQLRYGVRADGSAPKDSAEVILRAANESKDFSFFLDKTLSREYEYKLIADYRPDFGVGLHTPRVESPWIKTEATTLTARPGLLGSVLPVTVALAPNLPEDISEIQARVRYVNAAHNVDDSTLVRLDSNNRSAVVPVRVANPDDTFEVTQTIFFSDGTRQELAPITLPDPNAGGAEDTVMISAPRANRLEADVLMQDPLEELQSVLVDLQALQNGALVDSKSLELTEPGKLARWSVRLPAATPPPVLRYQQRRIFRDSGLETETWREAQSVNLVVGIPAEGTLRVVVNYLPLGSTLAALGIAALLVDLEYNDPNGDASFDQSASLLITDDAATHTQEWKVRLADRQARDYRWRITTLLADGTESAGEFQPSNRDKLILRAPQR